MGGECGPARPGLPSTAAGQTEFCSPLQQPSSAKKDGGKKSNPNLPPPPNPIKSRGDQAEPPARRAPSPAGAPAPPIIFWKSGAFNSPFGSNPRSAPRTRVLTSHPLRRRRRFCPGDGVAAGTDGARRPRPAGLWARSPFLPCVAGILRGQGRGREERRKNILQGAGSNILASNAGGGRGRRGPGLRRARGGRGALRHLSGGGEDPGRRAGRGSAGPGGLSGGEDRRVSASSPSPSPFCPSWSYRLA